MSSLSDLLLRETVDPNYQTKGSTLTFAELDGNLQLLADVIRENIIDIVPTGIESYDPGTEYESGDFVTYGGNLWEYIYPTPSTGNAPGLSSPYWTIQSYGALAHAQNTDTGTNSNTFSIGDGVAGNKDIIANNADVNKPRLRYNDTSNKWQFSNDGTTFTDFGSGGGGVSSRVHRFRFNSDLYTADEAIFRGVITSLAAALPGDLGSVTYAVRLGSSSTYTNQADLTAVQTWINSNITGTEASGTIFYIKVFAAYASGKNGIAEVQLTYTPS